MTPTSNSVYIYLLDNIINEYNNVCGITVKLKHIVVNSSMYIDLVLENNDKDPRFKISDFVRIPKYKNIFAKSHASNQLVKIFMTKKKIKVSQAYAIEHLNDEKIVRKFQEKELKNSNQTEKGKYQRKSKKQQKQKRKNVINFMLIEKAITIHLAGEYIKLI